MGKHPLPYKAHTRADAVRDDLHRCETLVVHLGRGAGPTLELRSLSKEADAARTNALLLLRLLDHIADELQDLEQRGVDLRAERGRFETILNQLRRRERALVALVGAEMPDQRPPNAPWWWHLERKVALDRKLRLRRVIGATLIGLAVLSALTLLYDRFLAPSPNIRQALALVFEGERAANEGDLTLAIELFEGAAALDPDRAEAHLWLGILYESTGETAKADAAFEQARAFLASDPAFLLQRGLFYLSLDDLDSAQRDANAAIDLAPQRPEGYFLRGSLAEKVGDSKLALDYFAQAVNIAESTGQVELLTAARLRIASIHGRLGESP